MGPLTESERGRCSSSSSKPISIHKLSEEDDGGGGQVVLEVHNGMNCNKLSSADLLRSLP